MDDEIKIKSEDNIIEVKDSKKINIEGKDNVVEVDAKDNKIDIKGDDNKIKIKKEFDWKKGFSLFKDKKVLNILAIILLLSLLIGGAWIRTQNIPLLKDSTTGEYIPLALDPFYWLRIAETGLNLGFNNMPKFDTMRQPFNVGWSPEILPKVIVGIYKCANIFGNYSLQYADILYPVIFFIFGLIVFFFLVYSLTKSKATALLASAFLAFIPSYLYRTMAGFADHEAIGIFSFFLALLIFSLSLKYLEKKSERKKGLIKTIGFGLLIGFVTALTVASWGGIAKFVFMIIPLGFILFWIFNTKKENRNLGNISIFYLVWIISSALFGMLFGYNLSNFINKFYLSSNGLISLFVLGFVIIDYFLIKNFKRLKKYKLSEKYRIIYTTILTIILGILFLFLIGHNPLSLISTIIERLLHPFGEGRVSLTVAENAQPYLTNWISQSGKTFFWMFIAGLLFIGLEVSRNIKGKKEKNMFIFLWILMFSGIIFSRISAKSILNGTNFISQIFYIGGLLLFIYYIIKLYSKNKINLNSGLIIIFSWMFFMIVSVRSAVRFFFVLAPFVCFSASYFVVKAFEYTKKNKDELIKILLIVLLVLGIFGSVYNLYGFYNASKSQAVHTGPSANIQWQNSMSWVRNNTAEGSIFVHWWDYGYWVQTLGKRPTIADGGHFQGVFRNHMIGRYLLTTPKPETALSFLKSNNISYLLIDPTDLGKYSAYSKIGSDNNWDRFSYISPFISDESKIEETSTGKIRIYQGGAGVDEDIVYNENGSQIFIPGPTYDKIGTPDYKAYLGGIILETKRITNSTVSLEQPEAVFIYNGQQIKIPLRYSYINGHIKDFGTGLKSVFFIFPSVNSKGEADNLGAGLYLSPKVSKSLFAQLYLMNDPFNEYSTIKLAHLENDPIVNFLKMQGLNTEFVYYNGFRGPIKIWDVRDIPQNILVKEEFLRKSGDWGEFDNLTFSS